MKCLLFQFFLNIDINIDLNYLNSPLIVMRLSQGQPLFVLC